jgi:hypothetical protein
MTPAGLSLDEREEALTRFLEKYARRGFKVVSRTATTAELFKPARFPEWLFPEQTRYVDIDEIGRIYVSKG